MSQLTPEEYIKRSIHGFIEYHGITNDQGAKLDFYDHPFMWDVYSDWSPKIVGLKAAQITWSTCMNIKALYAAKNFGLDIIYTLPSGNDVKDFVNGKTNRLIANNDIFQQWTADKDSVEQKKVGDNIIYFRGTWTERAAIAIPADLYICDEKDRSKQDIVAQYSSRLQHSKFAWEWEFSNPSAPGVGVDKTWQESDQKHWFVKCDGCNHKWYLTMENVMLKSDLTPYFGCLKCKKELNRRNGEWVRRWTDKEISGYWVSLLMAPWVSAKKIKELKATKTEEYFSNFVLGQPYVGKGNILTKSLLFQNLVDRVNPQDTRPVIGVDTGIDIRYVIGNSYGIFNYGECKDYSEIEKLMARMPTAIVVIDQGGDIIGPRKLREKYPNRVFLCFFRQDRKNDQLMNWNDDDNTVVADRNKMIQLVVDEFTEKRLPIFGTEAEWWDYWLHWSHVYRVEDEDKVLQKSRFVWMRSDRDDWALATVYWRIGMDRFAESYATFHDPSKANQIGNVGIDVAPDQTTRIGKLV